MARKAAAKSIVAKGTWCCVREGREGGCERREREKKGEKVGGREGGRKMLKSMLGQCGGVRS